MVQVLAGFRPVLAGIAIVSPKAVLNCRFRVGPGRKIVEGHSVDDGGKQWEYGAVAFETLREGSRCLWNLQLSGPFHMTGSRPTMFRAGSSTTLPAIPSGGRCFARCCHRRCLRAMRNWPS